MKTLIVNCDSCEVRGGACTDCVISALLGTPDADAAPTLSDEEQRVLGLFADSGMLPPLRLVQSLGTPDVPEDARLPMGQPGWAAAEGLA